MKRKKLLVRLWKRPSKDCTTFTYYLRYVDLDGIYKGESLGHCDSQKAEKQRLQKEKELRMGFCPPSSMRLKEFAEDSLNRTGNKIRPSTKEEYQAVIKDFLSVIGNVDIQSITLKKGEYYRQACFDKGNSPATVKKKLIEIKRLFELAVKRKQLDENPFKYIDMPVIQKKQVRIYSEEEYIRILKTAKDYMSQKNDNIIIRWDLLIVLN